MRRPHGRTRRGAPAPDAAILCAPLQRNQNAPIFEQRCATHTPGSAEWTHRVACHGRRATSPICSNLSFRHTHRTTVQEAVFRRTMGEHMARGRRWLDEIVAGTVTSVEQIAARDKCSIRQVNMTISLAFLAPEFVKAAVEGRLPRGIGVTRLRDAPAEWSRQ